MGNHERAKKLLMLGTIKVPHGFCGEPSWTGRADIHGNFLCEPCVKKAEALIAEERLATNGLR